MKFRAGDSMLSMSVIRPEGADVAPSSLERGSEVDAAVAAVVSPAADTPQYVFTITDGGFAKRTRIEEYRLQSRGGLGIKTMKQDDDRGSLVGGFIVVEGDEVLAIKQSGQVTRSAVDEHLRPTSRDTKGVKFVGVSEGDAVAVVARSIESTLDSVNDDAEGNATIEEGAPGDAAPVEPTSDQTDGDDAETEES
jgi:DNA gyrase subunit A